MSGPNPTCPNCQQPVPMRESASTSHRVPLSRVCTGCHEDLPDHLFGTPREASTERGRRRSRADKFKDMLSRGA